MKPITLRDGVPFCGDREIKIGDVLYTSGEIGEIDAGDTAGPVMISNPGGLGLWPLRGAFAAPPVERPALEPDLTAADLDAFESEIQTLREVFRHGAYTLCANGDGAGAGVVDMIQAFDALASLALRGPVDGTIVH